MGQTDGFLKFDRVTVSRRAATERLKDYKEIVAPLLTDEIHRQGARCMDCGIPFCHAMGCPIHNLIPEWNDAIYRGRWEEAYERLAMTNNLPEVTGRVCPAPCEAACTLAINSAPVTIEQIELAIIEKAFVEGWVKPCPPQRKSGKKIAIIGSGPSGLSSAQQLCRLGHQVTLFERSSRIGGILRFGIPDFKLEKWVLDRRMEQMTAEGVEFRAGVNVGCDISAVDLRKNYDVILLTMGAGEPRNLQVPGRGLQGVHFAMDFLTRSNKFVSGEISEKDLISAKGKTVLVIGGGDTGSDCVGTSNRQGAKKVYQFEILSKPREWKEAWNPVWPNWPQILRTSTSHEEGCERDWAITTKEFIGNNGRLSAVRCARVEWQKDRATGSFSMKELPGSEFTLQAELVLLAMGFVHVEHSPFLKELGVQWDARGNIQTNGNFMSSVPGVFAAGDTVRGASLVVWAIRQGRQAAQAIDTFLKS